MRPLRDMVIVLIVSQRRSAIYIPTKEQQEYGAVVAVGPKVTELLPGDIVYFPSNVGNTYQVNGANYVFMAEKEISALVEGERYAVISAA